MGKKLLSIFKGNITKTFVIFSLIWHGKWHGIFGYFLSPLHGKKRGLFCHLKSAIIFLSISINTENNTEHFDIFLLTFQWHGKLHGIFGHYVSAVMFSLHWHGKRPVFLPFEICHRVSSLLTLIMARNISTLFLFPNTENGTAFFAISNLRSCFLSIDNSEQQPPSSIEEGRMGKNRHKLSQYPINKCFFFLSISGVEMTIPKWFLQDQSWSSWIEFDDLC